MNSLLLLFVFAFIIAFWTNSVNATVTNCTIKGEYCSSREKAKRCDKLYECFPEDETDDVKIVKLEPTKKPLPKRCYGKGCLGK
ncbi:hypothetical protein TSAR_007822 [Trichomalopsis sarcophagae]|uniref:Uncharacterized protein n=1 Tax=Trichomalopsis sarcophagae TaxID=543379 RepID=A0A232FKS6_9HYME|nr:hypothetical protein TSAR_007822 [Trichomalopsis sarcophagae]